MAITVMLLGNVFYIVIKSNRNSDRYEKHHRLAEITVLAIA